MPAPHTIGQPSHPCRHPTCWASLKEGHAISQLTGSVTRLSALLQARRSRQAASRLRSWHPFVPGAKQFLSGPSRSKTSMWHGGQFMLRLQNGETVPQDCAPLSLMLDLTHWDWLCQDQCGQGYTTFEQVLASSAHPCTNGELPLHRSVSVCSGGSNCRWYYTKIPILATKWCPFSASPGWWHHQMALYLTSQYLAWMVLDSRKKTSNFN